MKFRYLELLLQNFEFSPIFHEKSQLSGSAILYDVMVWPIVPILVCMDRRDKTNTYLLIPRRLDVLQKIAWLDDGLLLR